MFGRFLYYLIWPILWFVTPLTRRVRVAVLYDGKVLLVQNWIGAGNWELPGGGIKLGETVEQAATREIREELRLHIENVSKLNEDLVTIKRRGILRRLEYVQATIGPTEVIIQNWEIAKINWVPISEFMQLDMMPSDLQQRLTRSVPLEDDTL